jgi:hypothetical protein
MPEQRHHPAQCAIDLASHFLNGLVEALLMDGLSERVRTGASRFVQDRRYRRRQLFYRRLRARQRRDIMKRLLERVREDVR